MPIPRIASDIMIAHELNLALRENAEDFLREAVKYTQTSTPRDWRFAILLLCSGLELLLKAVLEKEHWRLLFENADRASPQALRQGNFETVRFETALARVQNLVGVSGEPTSFKYLRQLTRLRNRATHFALRLTVDQAKSWVARGLTVFLALRQQHLDQTADKTLEDKINHALQDLDRYISERLLALRPALDAAERSHQRLRTCSSCLQDTLVFKGDHALCLFCGEEWACRDLAESNQRPGGQCPLCDEGNLSFVLLNNEEGHFVCVSCGFATAQNLNTECTSCGREFWNDNESLKCNDCYFQLGDKDSTNQGVGDATRLAS